MEDSFKSKNEKIDQLKKEFHRAMLDIYEVAKNQCGYKANRFLIMVHDRGGFETARYLLSEHNISEGFDALWEKSRLDLSVENVMLNPKWNDLFTDEERAKSRERLAEAKFKPQF